MFFFIFESKMLFKVKLLIWVFFFIFNKYTRSIGLKKKMKWAHPLLQTPSAHYPVMSPHNHWCWSPGYVCHRAYRNLHALPPNLSPIALHWQQSSSKYGQWPAQTARPFAYSSSIASSCSSSLSAPSSENPLLPFICQRF